MTITYDESLDDLVCTVGDMPWRVAAAEPRRDHTIVVTFITGEKKIYDARPLLDRVPFAPLKNIGFFMMAHVAGGTVVWNDDVDLAPEHLYEMSVPILQTQNTCDL